MSEVPRCRSPRERPTRGLGLVEQRPNGPAAEPGRAQIEQAPAPPRARPPGDEVDTGSDPNGPGAACSLLTHARNDALPSDKFSTE